MSQRTRASALPREGVTDEDIRRRLEGRAEVLDAALARDTALESLLRARGWRRKLRARPGLVPEWLAQEPAVAEALERVKRRADAEGWLEDTPVLVGARELAARRTRLVTLVRGRLSELATVSGAPSLKADLPRLDTLVRGKASLSLSPGEVLVFEGQQKWEKSQHIPPLLIYLLLTSLGMAIAAVVAEKLFRLGDGAALLLMALAAVPWMVTGLRSGRVWLTSERLLWQPLLGELVAVPLSSIRDGGVHLDTRWLNVRVEGERRAVVRHMTNAAQLAMLLELHRQSPLLGAARAGVRLSDVALYPAVLREGKAEHRGHAVLRPDGVSFIPDARAAEAFQAITGTGTALPVALAHVLDELRWLPDTEFDACVARAVKAAGGLRWSAWDSSYREGTPVWNDIRITRGARTLSGHVDWTLQGVTERILRAWPQSVGSHRGG